MNNPATTSEASSPMKEKKDISTSITSPPNDGNVPNQQTIHVVHSLPSSSTTTTTTTESSAAATVAQSQLDSDDEDTYKRSSRSLPNLPTKQSQREKDQLRQERAKLYTIQESKRRRREEADRSKKSNVEGDTPLLQKVKRLKKERRGIEVEYESTGGSMKKRKKGKKKRSSGFNLPK